MKTKEDPTARALRVWEKMAPRYDKDITFWEKVQFGGGREWVCSRATGQVLEVAVGTGRNFPFYGPVLRPGGRLLLLASVICRPAAASIGAGRRVMYSPAVGAVNSSISRCTAQTGHQRPPMWSGRQRGQSRSAACT